MSEHVAARFELKKELARTMYSERGSIRQVTDARGNDTRPRVSVDVRGPVSLCLSHHETGEFIKRRSSDTMPVSRKCFFFRRSTRTDGRRVCFRKEGDNS